MRSLLRGPALALVGFGLSACTSPEETEAPPIDTTVQPICTAGTRWTPGTQSFEEVTAAWGLTGVTGTRLNAVDVDGDGYPDLVVRAVTDEPSDFHEPPACCATATCEEGTVCPVQRVWYMRNTGTGSFED